jgi:hypothetical protein
MQLLRQKDNNRSSKQLVEGCEVKTATSTENQLQRERELKMMKLSLQEVWRCLREESKMKLSEVGEKGKMGWRCSGFQASLFR